MRESRHRRKRCACSTAGCDAARAARARFRDRLHSGRLPHPPGDPVHGARGISAPAARPGALRGDVMKRSRSESGQQAMEYVILYAGVLMPITFAIIFTAQVLWVWHSVVDFTRDGARYAATHCWQAAGDNVLEYMRTHVPLMVDRDQFQAAGQELDSGPVLFARPRDRRSGGLRLRPGECSTLCVPDTVTVRIQLRIPSAFLTHSACRRSRFRISTPPCRWRAPAAIRNREVPALGEIMPISLTCRLQRRAFPRDGSRQPAEHPQREGHRGVSGGLLEPVHPRACRTWSGSPTRRWWSIWPADPEAAHQGAGEGEAGRAGSLRRSPPTTTPTARP